jgi:hypothetical protein
MLTVPWCCSHQPHHPQLIRAFIAWGLHGPTTGSCEACLSVCWVPILSADVVEIKHILLPADPLRFKDIYVSCAAIGSAQQHHAKEGACDGRWVAKLGWEAGWQPAGGKEQWMRI